MRPPKNEQRMIRLNILIIGTTSVAGDLDG